MADDAMPYDNGKGGRKGADVNLWYGIPRSKSLRIPATLFLLSLCVAGTLLYFQIVRHNVFSRVVESEGSPVCSGYRRKEAALVLINDEHDVFALSPHQSLFNLQKYLSSINEYDILIWDDRVSSQWNWKSLWGAGDTSTSGLGWIRGSNDNNGGSRLNIRYCSLSKTGDAWGPANLSRRDRMRRFRTITMWEVLGKSKKYVEGREGDSKKSSGLGYDWALRWDAGGELLSPLPTSLAQQARDKNLSHIFRLARRPCQSRFQAWIDPLYPHYCSSSSSRSGSGVYPSMLFSRVSFWQAPPVAQLLATYDRSMRMYASAISSSTTINNNDNRGMGEEAAGDSEGEIVSAALALFR
eukprot:gene39999-48728_t